jgi:hypothetical protein
MGGPPSNDAQANDEFLVTVITDAGNTMANTHPLPGLFKLN